MFRLLVLAAIGSICIAAPSAALAQSAWNAPGYNEGYQRGQSAGAEDSRRGDRFEFTDESEYRRGDWGYRSQYGNRERYRDSFRTGYQQGYRYGYGGYGQGNGQYGNGRYGNGRYGGANPPWSNGRYNDRYDPAYQTGLNDGYEAGLEDGRDNRRFDPVSEGRFRSADRGYEREYGPRELYKTNYRDAFRIGYQRGYDDGRRYERRSGSGGLFDRFRF
jgi:flagellar biosynthesis/type III secretory pathway protein FliH